MLDHLLAAGVLGQLSMPGTWLHVHCAGGAGRTTTALTMVALLALRGSATGRHGATRLLHRVARLQYVLGGSWLLARPAGARLRAARDLMCREVPGVADDTQARRRWSPSAALSALMRSMHRTDDSGWLHPAPTRHEAYAARDAFLHLFAQYCVCAVGGEQQITWSDWLEQRLETLS